MRGRRQQKAGLEQGEDSIDLPARAAPPETAAAAREESWLERLTAETGSDFTAETALLLAILIGLALGRHALPVAR